MNQSQSSSKDYAMAYIIIFYLNSFYTAKEAVCSRAKKKRKRKKMLITAPIHLKQQLTQSTKTKRLGIGDKLAGFNYTYFFLAIWGFCFESGSLVANWWDGFIFFNWGLYCQWSLYSVYVLAGGTSLCFTFFTYHGTLTSQRQSRNWWRESVWGLIDGLFWAHGIFCSLPFPPPLLPLPFLPLFSSFSSSNSF